MITGGGRPFGLLSLTSWVTLLLRVPGMTWVTLPLRVPGRVTCRVIRWRPPRPGHSPRRRVRRERLRPGTFRSMGGGCPKRTCTTRPPPATSSTSAFLRRPRPTRSHGSSRCEDTSLLTTWGVVRGGNNRPCTHSWGRLSGLRSNAGAVCSTAPSSARWSFRRGGDSGCPGCSPFGLRNRSTSPFPLGPQRGTRMAG